MRRGLPTLAACLLLAGCGGYGDDESTPAPAPATTTAPAATTTAAPSPRVRVTVFRLRGAVLRAETVSVRGPRVAAAALREAGLASPVRIDSGTARVERPGAAPGEVAAIVYTLTQFPSVERVDVAGRAALTRADVAAFAPPILVERPAGGARVGKTIRVAGEASVYEATLVVELRRGAAMLQRQVVTATEGAPARGEFSATLTAPEAGEYVVAVYSPSAEDGSAQHEQDVPVEVVP